ncbi:hypothetical protein [Rhodoplanes roseus]|uniref:Uncharacterized protein n=1 Tax=Rhodoplanes roseus TaxID=29409 RepID=A0A327L3D6_9BRAD|nr:hypothetical protein [Rhodoplanes roseus]RAI44002.1 hypothetical protein CH341_11540 [Rhodoplanes roseus]
MSFASDRFASDRFEPESASPPAMRSGEPIRFDFARSGGDCRPCRAICQDAGEHLALALVRFVCAGYMTASADCWEAAHAHADATFGAVDGPPFVARAGALVRALRAERRAGFAFFPASCAQVSRDEAELIALVQAARAGDPDRLRRAGQKVGGGVSCGAIVTAARALAVLLNRYAALIAAGQGGGLAAGRGGAPN